MKTFSERTRDNVIKGLFLFALFIVLFTKSLIVDAQPGSGPALMGLEASFGVQSFAIESDLPQIDQMQVNQEGGSLGFVFGSEVLRTHVTLASIYYSAACVKRTVNQYKTGIDFTFHPVSMFSGHHVAFSPYVVTGAYYNDVRFFGHYNCTARINYSTTEEPYVGSVRGVLSSLGAGMEYSMRVERSFVQIFSEVTFGKAISMRANKETLGNTTITDPLAVRVGIRFGVAR